VSESYYNNLAPYYKYVYRDWESSVARQAGQLDAVIRHYFPGTTRILDAACGIGTQAIGLAQLGYRLSAADISPAAVVAAHADAGERGLEIEFAVGDMRHADETFPSLFDLVIACDNAVPHLLTDVDILQAFEAFHRCTTSQGGCIISVRDYTDVQPNGVHFNPRIVHDTPDGKLVLFDLWAFEGEYYDLITYVIEDDGERASVQALRGGHYYCVPLSRLEALLREAGFKQVEILKDAFFQPLLVGIKDPGFRIQDQRVK
jgi:SAM-dependent methyltransferase